MNYYGNGTADCALGRDKVFLVAFELWARSLC